MVQADEDALICDFAETYHLYDYKRLPLRTAASLAVGLRNDSRIKMHLSGSKVAPDLLLLAAIADRLGLLIWSQTKRRHGRPKSILEALTKTAAPCEHRVFQSGEDFHAAREAMIRQMEDAHGD